MEWDGGLAGFMSKLPYGSQEIGSSFGMRKSLLVVRLEAPPPLVLQAVPESLLLLFSDVFSFEDLVLHLFSTDASFLLDYPHRSVLLFSGEPVLFLTSNAALRHITHTEGVPYSRDRLRFLQRRVDEEVRLTATLHSLLDVLRRDVSSFQVQLADERNRSHALTEEYRRRRERGRRRISILEDEVVRLKEEKKRIEQELMDILRSPGYRVVSGVGGLLGKRRRKEG